MFLNQDELDEDKKHLHLCVPGNFSNNAPDYDSASPFFNYSIDCSLGNFQGNFSVDFNWSPECSTSCCSCHGTGECRYCMPVEATSSVSVGPLSLRISSSARRRGIRGCINTRENQNLPVLRGVVKTPRFYRIKARKMNEALLFSINSSRTPSQSPTRYAYSRSARFSRRDRFYRDSRFPSKIPYSTELSSMFLDKDNDAENIKEAIEGFNSLSFGQLCNIGQETEDNNDVLALTNSLSNTTLSLPKSDYEDELCSRIIDMPLQELKNETEEPLVAVNSLLENLQSFTVSADVKPEGI